MAILNHGSTIRTADGGQSTTTIVTATNIGTYGVAANSPYYIGTTQNIFNRASGAQTLTGVNVDGNSGGIYAAGGASIKSSTTGTAYTSHIQIREADGGGSNTSEIYAPALGFHWAGVVASNILMESSGRIAIRNNPGSGYENFIAAIIYAGSSVQAPIFYDSNNTSYYLDPANTGTSLLVAGSIGAGLTTPLHKIQASGLISASDATYNNDSTFIGAILNNDGTNPGLDLRRWNGGAAGTNNHGTTYIATNSAGDTIFYNGLIAANTRATNEKMRIAVNGNVGIGTTSPNTKFEVSGPDASTIQAIFQSSTGAAVAYNGGIQLGNGSSNQNSQIYHNSSGDNTLTFVSNYGGGTANKFVFAPGGTERVRFQQNGNVGIGTTSPRVLLDLAKANNVGQVLLLGETGANIRVGFGLNPSNAGMRIFSYNHISDGLIEFGGISSDGSTWTRNHRLGLAGGNSFFNEQGGNVGIGTTSPAYKLDITGDARIASAAGDGALYFGTLDPSNIYLKRDNNYDLSLVQNASSGNALYLAGAGNVYISIDSNNNETDRAFIIQNNSIKSGTELFRVQENGVVTASTDIRAPIFYDSNDTTYFIDPANGGFNLRGGNSNRVTFNSGDSGIIVTNAEGVSSNVRLGCAWGRPGIYNGSSITIGAETTIDFVIANFVKGYIDSSSNLFSNGSVRSPIFYDSNNTAYYLDAANSGTSLLVAGNVGIGTTNPVTKLHVEQIQNAESLVTLRNDRQDLADVPIFGISAQNSVTNVAKISFYRGGGGNSGYLTFSTKFDNASSLTEKVRIDGAGNVGIGTTSPSQKLHVVGTGFASTDFRAPIFYDSDDTAYYLDPANTTLSLKTRSSIIINNASAPQNLAMLNIGYNGAGETRAIDIYGSWSGGENKSITFNHASGSANIVAQINAQHNGPASRLRFGKLYHGGDSSTYTMELVSESTTTAALYVFGSVRSPIFYDNDNTVYYIDAAGTSNLAGLAVANTITGSISGNAATATTSSQLGGVAAASYVRNDVDGTNSTALFRLKTITKSLTITTSWIDTGIVAADLSDSGAYMLTLSVDNYAVGGGHYNETYTGIMYWYAGGTNATDYDEIVLHKSGHAPNGAYINLRTIRQLSGSTNLKLQIISSVSTSGASNYVFKFRRLI